MNATAFYILIFLSGVAGLGYELLWTRMLSVSLGHEIVSVLAVVSAFFTGLAIGAWVLDRPISRSFNPARWFALCETVIGLWALALLRILPPVNEVIAGLIGAEPSPLRHWSISFFYPMVVMLPATIAMGATLPAMDRLCGRQKDDRRSVAGLYSANTFGAVAGTVLVTFLLLPAFGVPTTSLVLAVINFIGAAGVIFLSRGKNRVDLSARQPVSMGVSLRGAYPSLFITGLLGIGFEVTVVRALSQILENTVFSFAAMLTVFLFGTATGAAVYQRAKRVIPLEHGLSLMMTATAFFCLISIFLLRYVEPLFHLFQNIFGKGFPRAVAAELSLSLLVFLLPTASMGVTFSHLAQSLKGPDGGVGRALCLNILGGAMAPLIFGILLLPRIGIQYTLLIVPIAYLLCMPRFRRAHSAAALILAVATLWIGLTSKPHPFMSLSEGDTIVSYQEGVMASVSVVKDNRDHMHLKVNNHFQMGGTGSVFSDRRQAFLPLLLHPDPRNALFLGLGAGITFSAAGMFPELEAVGVELIPEVVAAMGYFEKVTSDFGKNTSLRIVNADVRRYVAAVDQSFDVVVADLFHPSRDGAGSLYTVEHFRAIREVLAENGLFCQWLPLYQLDLEMFKVITRTFLQVFPEAQAYLCHYSVDQPIVGLIGGRKPLRFPENGYEKRMHGRAFQNHMAGFGFDSVYSLLGTFMADGDSLAAFAGSGPLNTDENPVIVFRAPRFVYGNPVPPRERLEALVEAFSLPDTESILAEVITEEDCLARPRLAAYWSARNRFLKLGMSVEHTDHVTRLYEAVSAPLLAIVRESIDFSAAYYPLISIAYEMYPHDRNASHRLLRDLERANPLKPEAGILRQQLFAALASP